ncbi:MAG: allophanate hydrolase subunit 2 family protein, partial [Hamadaea sp.]|nr:allophanate hydrolase subunit 2 family protein [Hamadaea sp.]
MLEVVRTGGLATVQDRGRPGHAHLGVPPSGALDGPALALANRLVGNPPEAAGLEVTLGGLVLRTLAPVTVAVTGAPGPL